MELMNNLVKVEPYCFKLVAERYNFQDKGIEGQIPGFDIYRILEYNVPDITRSIYGKLLLFETLPTSRIQSWKP